MSEIRVACTTSIHETVTWRDDMQVVPSEYFTALWLSTWVSMLGVLVLLIINKMVEKNIGVGKIGSTNP